MSLIISLSPSHIWPPHEVRNAAKLQKIASSMEENGWTGRPLLALDLRDHYRAITGSHRIAAAVVAGLEKIPVYVLNADGHEYDDYGCCVLCGSECWMEMLIEAGDDDERLDAIIKSGDPEAVSIMEMELEERE